jgi:hypothetical protein
MTRLTVVLIFAPFAAASSGYAEVTLENGYSQMYNLQFEEAHGTFHEWERLHAGDPMGPVSDAAAFLFEELDRLHVLQSEFFVHDQHWITDHKLEPDPGLKLRFENALEASRELSSRKPDDENSQFASILRTGLHSDYMALIAKRYVASLQEMKTGRMMAEKLLAKDPNLYDAWIAVGVENYMLSVKAGASEVGPAADGRANGPGDRDRKTEAGRREGPLFGALRAVDAGGGGAARQRSKPRPRDLVRIGEGVSAQPALPAGVGPAQSRDCREHRRAMSGGLGAHHLPRPNQFEFRSSLC